MTEFVDFGKIARFRDTYNPVTISEKIDGSQGGLNFDADGNLTVQSRKKVLDADNGDGFFNWATENRESLFRDLGPGVHFGEWYGRKIQRTYGLDHKRFALFNAARFRDAEFETLNLETVPLLFHGVVGDLGVDLYVDAALDYLNHYGSAAVPGFRNYEGVVVFFTSNRTGYKVIVNGKGGQQKTVTDNYAIWKQS